MVPQLKKPSRSLPLVAVLATGCLVLAGCGREDTADNGAGQAEALDGEASGTVDFWAFSPDGDQIDELLEPFLNENPDIELNLRTIPEEEYNTALMAAVTSGNVPDIAVLQSQDLASMLSTGAFSPMPEGLVEADAFFESSWETGTLDGTAYAVPWYSYANVVYYRTDIFDEVGVEPPSTWEELYEVSEALIDAGYDTPYATDVGYDSFSAQAFQDFVRQAGGSLISEDQTEWTIDTPEAHEAIEHWVALFDNGYSSPEGPQFLDRVPYMIGDDSAFMINGPWFPGWLDEAAGDGWTDDHLGAAVPPSGPDSIATSFGGGSLVVLEDGDNPDAAWMVAQYMAGPEVQAEWYSMFGNLPAVEASWNDESIADDPLLEAVQESLPYAEPTPGVPGWEEVGNMIGEELERVTRGDVSPEDALASLQERADAIPTGVE